jgi:hypothetical protein
LSCGGLELRQVTRKDGGQLKTRRAGLFADDRFHRLEYSLDFDRFHQQGEIVAVDLGEFQDVVDPREKLGSAGTNVFGVFPILIVAQGSQRLAVEDLGETDHGVQRGAQFVAHHGQEVGFRAAGDLRPLLGVAQFEFHPLALADL